MTPETLVGQYLARLEELASGLPADRRGELVDEVREHIEFALAEADRADEATVRNILDRLGSPEEIVAAELDGPTSPAIARAQAVGPGRRDPGAPSVESRALLLLTVGALLLPFLGPVLGLWYASASNRWSLAQKRTAALIVVEILVLPVTFIIPALLSGEITWAINSGGFLLPLIPASGIVAAAYLVGSTSVEVTVSRRHES
jgi:hypothetical protein